MPFSGPFRYYSIFVLLFVTIRRFGGPTKIMRARLISSEFGHFGLGLGIQYYVYRHSVENLRLPWASSSSSSLGLG